MGVMQQQARFLSLSLGAHRREEAFSSATSRQTYPLWLFNSAPFNNDDPMYVRRPHAPGRCRGAQDPRAVSRASAYRSLNA